MWAGGLPQLSGLPHQPGVPHLHVNRLLNSQHSLKRQELNGKNAVQVIAVLFGVKIIFYHHIAIGG